MKLRLSLIALFALIVLAISTQTFAQPALPDFSKWDSEHGTFKALHNGKVVTLKNTLYINVSDNGSRAEGINVFSDENQKPWLLFYTIETDPNKPTEYYLFEYKNNKWVMVKEFNDSNNVTQEAVDFLRSRYNLDIDY